MRLGRESGELDSASDGAKLRSTGLMRFTVSSPSSNGSGLLLVLGVNSLSGVARGWGEEGGVRSSSGAAAMSDKKVLIFSTTAGSFNSPS